MQHTPAIGGHIILADTKKALWLVYHGAFLIHQPRMYPILLTTLGKTFNIQYPKA